MNAWKQIPLFLIAFALCSCNQPSSTPSTEAPAGAEGTTAESGAPNTPGAAPAASKAIAAKPTVTIPAATEIQIVLTDSLNSGKNNAGDEFTGSIGAPVAVDGVTALAKGAKVFGKVVASEGSGRVKGLASMRLTLTEVMVNDQKVPITTKPFALEAEDTKKRDAGIIGGAAGVGAVVGAIAGGGKGAVTGAVIGGSAGTGTVLATKGKEVELPSETKLRFKLDQPLTVTP
jgi:hypothetical protein